MRSDRTSYPSGTPSSKVIDSIDGCRPALASEISRQQAGSRPVFVTGVPRSGTTVFFHCIERHPTFRVRTLPLGSYALESQAFTAPEALARIEPKQGNRQAKFMGFNETAITDFVETLSQVPAASTVVRKLAERLSSSGNFAVRRLSWQARGHHHAARLFFYYSARARGAHRMLEKTPDHSLKIPEIWASFTDASVFFVYRHPVNVYSSYRKRLQQGRALGSPESKLRWLSVSPEEFCRSYRDRVKQALRFGRKNPSRFMRVRYEDFAVDPRPVLRTACDFVGEPFKPDAMLPRLVSGSKKRAWDSVAPSTVRWDDYVEPEEAKLIEDRLQPLFVSLGFERQT